MRKAILLFLCVVGLAALSFGQDVKHVSPFGFRFEAGSTGTVYSWTNNNAYPFRIYSMQFNTDTASTNTFTVLRAHSVEQQWYSSGITTNAYTGLIETNVSYRSYPTNLVTMYETNLILSVTNTATIYDEDDFSKFYIQIGDILRWTFSVTALKEVLFDAIR